MIQQLKTIVIVLLLSLISGFIYSEYKFKQGIELGKNEQIALQAKVDAKVQDAKEELKLAVAEGLKQIEVKNVTINNKAVKEVVKESVYTDCKLTAGGMSVVTEALKPRN